MKTMDIITVLFLVLITILLILILTLLATGVFIGLYFYKQIIVKPIIPQFAQDTKDEDMKTTVEDVPLDQFTPDFSKPIKMTIEESEDL